MKIYNILMLHIYYGPGKGKTSALNGAALRAKGAGMQVAIFRFLKGRKSSENDQLIKLGIPVIFFHYTDKFVINMTIEEKFKTRNVVKSGLDFIIFNKDKYDLIILDEILDLIADNVNLISKNELYKFINQLAGKEVFISGHIFEEKIFDQADLITYFKAERHYFDKGIQAKKGIEY